MVSSRFLSVFLALATFVAFTSAIRSQHDAALSTFEKRLNKRAGLPGARPQYATNTLYNMDGGSTLFAWKSKRPYDEAQTEHVVISMHGVDRNAGDYFTVINNAYVAARNKGLPRAQGNVLRIAPLFFAAGTDASKLNASTLAWSDDNGWAAADVTQHPSNVQISSLTVFDNLINLYSDKSKYPKVKTITFAGHGGGGLIIQRLAALRNTNGADSRVALRYVVANPSTMLYFTKDRPTSVNANSCDVYNLFYYGLDEYSVPYSANVNNPGALFRAYAGRDVRYLVGVKDKSSTDGDQSCGARAQGGPRRDSRTLSYWKYVNYLAKGAGKQQQQALSSYPGNFTALESGKTDTSAFQTSAFRHTIGKVQAGHVVNEVFSSPPGLTAIFGA